jgi:hypothetical protein
MKWGYSTGYNRLAAGLHFQIHQQRIHIGGVDAANAGRLPHRQGTHLTQFFPCFLRQGIDRPIVQIRRQFAVGVAADLLNLGLLAMNIARIFDVNLGPFPLCPGQVRNCPTRIAATGDSGSRDGGGDPPG